MRNNWNTGGVDIGDLRMMSGDFDSRIGHSWAKGRLKAGDILVAIRHSGDCFHDYLLLEHSKGVRSSDGRLFVRPVPAPIGAYVLGEHVGTLDMEHLGLAMAGKSFDIEMIHLPEIAVDPRVAALGDYIVGQAMQYDPDFANAEGKRRIHDWRSHVGESVAAMWPRLPREVCLAIAADAEYRAGQEEYD